MHTAATTDQLNDRGIYRLVVISRSALPSGVRARMAGLSQIIASAQINNAAEGLSAVLALHRDAFALVVEGAEAHILRLLERIRRDERHRDVQILHLGPVSERRLPPQAMLLVGHDAGSRELLILTLDRIGREPVEAEAVVEALRAAAAIAMPNSAVLAGSPDDPAPRFVTDPTRSFDVDRVRNELAAVVPGCEAAKQGLEQTDAVAHGESPTFDDDPVGTAADATLATCRIAADGKILHVNGNFAAVLDSEAAALVGTDYQGTVHRDDTERFGRAWTAMLRGEVVRIIRRVARWDGREAWLRSVFHPRFDDAGHLHDVTEIGTDVTDEQLRRFEEHGQTAVVQKVQAVVQFDLDGTILDANDLFLSTTGYARDDAVGRHHRMFVEPSDACGPEYAAFWAGLAAGEPRSGEFRRFAKDGSPVWLQATYSPIRDLSGRPYKVAMYATVITEQKLQQVDYRWQVGAIHKSHAVISFDMAGVILDANDTFLAAVDYTLDEIVGRHHRLFVEPSYVHSAEYAAFWRELGSGRHQAGQYRRIGRDGREVWLQATYNPIFDVDGQPIRVVKYATVVTEEKLRQAEHQGQIAAIHKSQAVISFALDGIIIDANDNFLATMGYRLADVRGCHHRMFVEPGYAQNPKYANFWADLAAGQHKAGEFKRLGRDGREVWLQATYNPILDMNGRPFRIIKYATDITAEKLRQADIDGQIAAIHRSQGVIAFALDGTITEINDGFLATLGYARDELLGRHHSVLVDPTYAAGAEYAEFWRTLRTGAFLSGRYQRLGKNGRGVWIQATYNPILDLNGRPSKIIKFATDVTADVSLAEAYEDAKRQAQHDAATALPNRVRLASYMTTALADPSGRLTVLYLDLDRFKPINDTFGHAVGDRVLGEIADRLRRSLAPDQIAARVGGDEFVVVAPGLNDDAIEPFCQRLLDLVSVPIRHEGGELTVGVSIGIAVSPTDGTTPDELLRSADAALYRSKQNGRGSFSFYAVAMNERVLAYRNLVDDMRRGLGAGEFFLEYQPRYGARERDVQSVEALVRWSHPQRGRVNPGEFIPLAEKSGLIVPLGEWVMRTACRAATEWADIGVSVNVSPVQFRASDVVGVVTAALAESGLDPSRLELEITEGVLLEDAERARTALAGLKRLGVRLAMDDFGTGYSSLSSLRSFPFDVIKIDRQFVADIDGRAGGRAVVQAILGLGRALGLSVTAEGVETADQLRMLAEDACHEVQGFHLARPMAAEKVGDLLTSAASSVYAERLRRSG